MAIAVAQPKADEAFQFVATAKTAPWMARFFELQARLEALLGRKVDLMMAASVRNPYLLRSINQDRQVLYAA